MFTIVRSKKKGAILSHVNIFLSFLLIVLAANIALTTSMYVTAERHSVNLAQSSTVEELSQISYSTNFMFEAAKLTLLQLYSNPAALKLMNYDELGQLETSALLRQVGVDNVMMPFVNSIYIYNKQAQKMYFDGKAFPVATFPDQDMVTRLQEPVGLRNLQPIPRSIPSPDHYMNALDESIPSDNVYSFVLFDGSSNMIDNAIILNVSQEWLADTIEAMDPRTGKETVIVDSGGTITLGNERYRYLDDLSGNSAVQDVLRQSEDTGYAVAALGGEKFLVTYVSSPMLDWKYIRFTPYEAVSGKLKQLLLTTLVIFALVTVLSVVAVLFNSRTVYGRFSRKISEMEKKYDKEKHAGYEKKQQFLRMLTARTMEDSVLVKRFARYGIGFELNRSFMTVVLKIDRYDEFCGKYAPEDRVLLSYGLINIIGELSVTRFTHEAVDLGGGFIGILFNPDRSDYEEITVKMEGLIKEIQDKSAHYLGLSLSAALGDLLDEIADVPGSIEQCKEALQYKLYHGPRAVLYVSVVKELKKRDYPFPERSVAELFEYLLAGSDDSVRTCCRSIIEGTRGYSVASLQTTVLRLAIEMQDFVRKYELPTDGFDYNRFIAIANRIAAYETVDEIALDVQEQCASIAAYLSSSRETVRKYERYSGILDNVQQFLEREYANANLSPELIADQLGISAKYLRSLYKKASGESLGETINRYRIDRSKRLLEHPEISVQEAALRSGFTNINYFYTLFKKYNGSTPNEFRNLRLADSK
ncbi:AraC family transcriptional regulator [Cohnella fermenti]|uniref:AraC family transcriptional regulator n=1 Tax=Cohnella fermenti TaxID=2565925 RepID=A0A4S4C0V3_9BACL|nr:AraC family transcriptional regulator [Cohnella fermenti]THF79115.1 AraC family transcriptional regulator [Cohnella fermenti]